MNFRSSLACPFLLLGLVGLFSCSNTSKSTASQNSTDTVATTDTSAYLLLATAGSAPLSRSESQIYDSMLEPSSDPSLKLLLVDSSNSFQLDTVALPANLGDADTSSALIKATINGATARLINHLIQSYDSLNAQRVNWTPYNLGLEMPYSYLPNSVLDSLFANSSKDQDWAQFDKRYPLSQGFCRLSRIAFTQDSTWAIVTTSCSANSLAGYSSTYLFLQQNGTWTKYSPLHIIVS